MSHLPFTILAYFLNSLAVTVDKFLLVRRIPDPLIYIFYFSLFSLLALILLPFISLPPPATLALASLSTLLWTTGAYFMFKALQSGLISRVVPVIGTLIPLILLVEALLSSTLNLNQIWAVGFLVLGLILLTLPDWKGTLTARELMLEILASIFFALSYLVLRQAYLQAPFLSVFVSSRLILIPIGAVILALPSLRKVVLNRSGPGFSFFSKSGGLFLAGQAAGGTSELLLTFSVSLATPALVNSLQGVQYVFLFLFALVLSRKLPQVYKEDLSFLNVAGKILGIAFIAFGLYILAFAQNGPKKAALGVTYSPYYAKLLGLDPKQTYLQMLSDLKPEYVRLPLYWNEVEKQPGDFDLSAASFYLDNATSHGVKTIVVVGMKVPRWPECFQPDWVGGLDAEQKQSELLKLVRSEVAALKYSPSVIAWQVENEPLFGFGICPKPNLARLEDEIKLVRATDPDRPVLVTDSGELSLWVAARQQGDWFGTTMYRTVWDKYLGSFNYPLPPLFYQLKRNFTALFAPNKKELLVELQAEPWLPGDKQLIQYPPDEQARFFKAERIRENIDYARLSGFDPILLWGVEWWYYMGRLGHPEYLQTAKQLFN